MKSLIYPRTISIVILFVIYDCLSLSQNSKLTWDFPIRPGTPEWALLDSYESKLAAYNIPENILDSLSTNALVDACFSYPEWRLIDTRNSYCDGLRYVLSLFNGFNKLFEKKDGASILVSRYKNIDPTEIKKDWSMEEIGENGFKIVYLELLLSQPIILSYLTLDQENDLLLEAIEKYNSKKSLPNIYSLYGLCPTVMICATILERNNFSKELDQSKLIFLTHFGLINDLKFLDEVVLQSELYLNK